MLAFLSDCDSKKVSPIPNYLSQKRTPINSAFEETEQYLDCAGVETFVRIIGEGPPVVVVNGGPGFSHDYLVSHLEFLSNSRKLIFYDQPGCGRSASPTQGPSVNHTFEHFNVLCAEMIGNQRAGVIAHSWGATIYVAARSGIATDETESPHFAEGVLINPAPTTAKRYSLVYQELIKNIPNEKMIEITKILGSNDELEDLITIMLPYYSKNKKTFVDHIVVKINKNTYNSIINDIPNLNSNDIFSSVENISILIGEFDYAGTKFIDDIVRHSKFVDTVPKSAHFPFIENRDEFIEKVSQLFD